MKVTETMKNEPIILMSAPGRCCPDFACSLKSWNGKTCRECGCSCAECECVTKKREMRCDDEEGYYAVVG